MSISYIPRDLGASILEASQYFPVITLTGPRQSGKSTLLRNLFPSLPYVSIEDPDVRRRAIADPRSFLMNSRTGVIIDKIQRVPDLLSYIQTIVDTWPDSKFYITGSSQFALLKNITQSLAGRTAVFELLPLSIDEILAVTQAVTPNLFLYQGFYPAIWAGKNVAKFFYPSYVKTYLERDVHDLLNIKNLDTFQRFIRLCAARIGSIFVASELANELGVSASTINSWLSVLQASYIVYLLPPFFTNTHKRLIKSPKIYFTDCGLASYLLEIDSPERLDTDKMRGHLYENMIVMQFLKKRYNAGRDAGLYFYRDSNGNEVDLLVRAGGKYECYEIKSSATFHSEFTKGLKNFAKTFPELVASQKIIYTGEDAPAVEGIEIVNYLTQMNS